MKMGKHWYAVEARFYDPTYKRWKGWQFDMSFDLLKQARRHRKEYEERCVNMGYKIGVHIVTRILKCEVMT